MKTTSIFVWAFALGISIFAGLNPIWNAIVLIIAFFGASSMWIIADEKEQKSNKDNDKTEK